MYKISDFLNKIQEIVDTNPTYKTGGVGKDGTCDCIGLVMGAMYRLGHKTYPLHSTNYFSRREMVTLNPMTSANDLFVGEILYKSREENDQLHSRYREGGRYYKEGDLLDYYHAGVVVSVQPLKIVHCTSTNNVDGIATDVKYTSAWNCGGQLIGLDYSEVLENVVEEEIPLEERLAEVFSDNGEPVRVRNSPSTKGSKTLTKLAIGTQLLITESAKNDVGESWSTIKYGKDFSKRGYMMSAFLRDVTTSGGVTENLPADTVVLTLNKSVALELYGALQKLLGG